MTRTAKRRWTRELTGEVDGIAFGPVGPVFVHAYDPPAGGKWLDDVIPGKLGAFDRASGEPLWSAPCEIGYGRGFGAGFGETGDLVMLGPSLQGHRIARMRVDTGEVLGAGDIRSFDEAVVGPDLCVTIGAGMVASVLTEEMIEAWTHVGENERYHRVIRDGDQVHVLYSDKKTKQQGVLSFDAKSGELAGRRLDKRLGDVSAMAAGEGVLVLAVDDLESALPPDDLRAYLEKLAAEDDAGGDFPPIGPSCHLLALRPEGRRDGRVLWTQSFHADDDGDLPELTTWVDSGKLYVARGAVLTSLDLLSGRTLGEEAVPGLDEHVAWGVASGAVLVAEETRVSIFEFPH